MDPITSPFGGEVGRRPGEGAFAITQYPALPPLRSKMEAVVELLSLLTSQTAMLADLVHLDEAAARDAGEHVADEFRLRLVEERLLAAAWAAAFGLASLPTIEATIAVREC
ncbi:MAG TPA: hypothetical protein VHB74_08440 [Devosia sp.]|nr:hypothetical protein [Devosia sp.]